MAEPPVESPINRLNASKQRTRMTGQRSNQLNYDPAIGCSGLAETLINTGDSTYSTVSPVSSISTKYHHLMFYGLYANPSRLVRLKRNIWPNRTPLIVTDCAQASEIRHLPCGCSKRTSPHNCNQALLCPSCCPPHSSSGDAPRRREADAQGAQSRTRQGHLTCEASSLTPGRCWPGSNANSQRRSDALLEASDPPRTPLV